MQRSDSGIRYNARRSNFLVSQKTAQCRLARDVSRTLAGLKARAAARIRETAQFWQSGPRYP
jgi:hypothetical protein